jgi:hypothetical protein
MQVTFVLTSRYSYSPTGGDGTGSGLAVVVMGAGVVGASVVVVVVVLVVVVVVVVVLVVIGAVVVFDGGAGVTSPFGSSGVSVVVWADTAAKCTNSNKNKMINNIVRNAHEMSRCLFGF